MRDDGADVAFLQRPVAWSRHNLVAVCASDADGPCILVAPVRGETVAAPTARLRPKGGSAVPTHVSFSPCGHTIAAYFPALRPVSGARPMSRVSSAQDASGTPGGPTSLPTLEQLAGAGPAASPSAGGSAVLGQIHIWTYDGSWSLQQSIVAHASEADGMLCGDVATICWLGEWRAWVLGEPFARAQMHGPPMFSRNASMPLDEAQQEQGFVVVSRVGHIALIHRVPDATEPFRMLHGWVHRPCVFPPPATIDAFTESRPEHSDAASDDGMIHLAHVACGLVPSRKCALTESALLIAYSVSDELRSIPAAHETRTVCVSEVRIELEGEMSFLTVRPMEPATTAEAQVTALAWAPALYAPKKLRLFVAAGESDSRIAAFDVAQRAAGKSDLPAQLGPEDGSVDWSAAYAGSVSLHGRVSALMCPPHAGPDGRTVLGTVPGAWVTFDVDSLVERTGAPLTVRGELTLSPAGVLACARTGVDGHVAIMQTPNGEQRGSAGRLLALSLLRRCDASDVACWMRLNTSDMASAVPEAICEASAALGMHSNGEPTLRHTLQLVNLALPLVDASEDPALRRLYWRLCVVHALSRVYAHLWSARTDANTQESFGADTSFDPKSALALLSHVQRALTMLEQAARGSVAAAVPELSVLTIPAPQWLFAQVLVAIHAFVSWLERVSSAQWAEPLVGASFASPGTALAFEHVRVQLELARRAAESVRNAAVDVGLAARALANAQPVSAPFWQSMFGTLLDGTAEQRAESLSSTLLPAVRSRERLATQDSSYLPAICEV